MARPTGGIVIVDGPYTYHKFVSDGTFVVNKPGTIEVVLVGGGGSGGYGGGGGGGAGGLIWKHDGSALSISAGNFPVVIGQGGVTSYGSLSTGFGGNTTFNGLVALGGGRGGDLWTNGFNGGSGGGAGALNGTTYGGSATQPGSSSGGYGYAGAGNGSTTYNWQNGGGGGAGGVGGLPVHNVRCGNGGPGLDIWGYALAGGGAGGPYWGFGGTATHGGGWLEANGSPWDTTTYTAHKAIDNTGGGGAASSTAEVPDAYNGASGVVIIRYLTNDFVDRRPSAPFPIFYGAGA